MVIQTLVFIREWQDKLWIDNLPHIDGEQDRIRDFKFDATPMEMCAGAKTLAFTKLLEEAYSYSYEQTPRYDHLKSILMDILKDQGQEEIAEFSWNKKFFAEFESIIKAEPSVYSLDSGDDSENFEEEDL